MPSCQCAPSKHSRFCLLSNSLNCDDGWCVRQGGTRTAALLPKRFFPGKMAGTSTAGGGSAATALTTTQLQPYPDRRSPPPLPDTELPRAPYCRSGPRHGAASGGISRPRRRRSPDVHVLDSPADRTMLEWMLRLCALARRSVKTRRRALPALLQERQATATVATMVFEETAGSARVACGGGCGAASGRKAGGMMPVTAAGCVGVGRGGLATPSPATAAGAAGTLGALAAAGRRQEEADGSLRRSPRWRQVWEGGQSRCEASRTILLFSNQTAPPPVS